MNNNIQDTDLCDELYELKKKMEWLINGYHVNCVLPFVRGRFSIPTEYIVTHYNVEWSFFKKKK